MKLTAEQVRERCAVRPWNKLSPEQAASRFWTNVEKTASCWNWKGRKDRGGYGEFWFMSKDRRAHRISWYLVRGEFPALHIDHLCRNRACVNPDHMEEVTNAVNSRRGNGPGANYRKTHCLRGHAFDDVNTIWSVGKWGHPRRECRECKKMMDHQRYLKRR